MKNYSNPNGSAWKEKAMDLFLEHFRGLECEICGSIEKTCGHHIIFQSQSRDLMFSRRNILILCNEKCHSEFNNVCSPHSVMSTFAQWSFMEWIRIHKPSQFEFLHGIMEGKITIDDTSHITYRDWYELMGGKIQSKTGLKKDFKPYNHKESLERIGELRDGR